MRSPLHKRPETPFASFPGTCVPSTPYIFTDIYLTFISTPLFRSSAFSNFRHGPLCLLAVYLVAHLVGSQKLLDEPVSRVLKTCRSKWTDGRRRPRKSRCWRDDWAVLIPVNPGDQCGNTSCRSSAAFHPPTNCAMRS